LKVWNYDFRNARDRTQKSYLTGIDSNLSDNFGRSVIYGLSAMTTLVTVSVIGGPPFIFAAAILGVIYWNGTSTPSLQFQIDVDLGPIPCSCQGSSSLNHLNLS
jgi:hypothetical protein